jgi:hypothetical protein
MRVRFAASLLMLLASSFAQAQDPDTVLEDFTLTDNRTNPCLTFPALEQIARRAQVSLGMEQEADCLDSWRLDGDQSVSGRTAREAFDLLLKDASFDWREEKGLSWCGLRPHGRIHSTSSTAVPGRFVSRRCHSITRSKLSSCP